MNPIAAARRFVSSLARLFRREELRFVRRVAMQCPHGRGTVEIDLLTDSLGKPQAALRCSAHESCPPTCDQACRRCAEAVLTPAEALIVYPTADRPPWDAPR